MFSFHKPKVYRSPTGCCICRAKSSSSRFTDSKKYENDFMECFQLGERRTGEICNACVLLVKRWKKLPDGSVRNWRHVVDARAGPGTKSLAKFKSKNKKKIKVDQGVKLEKLIKKKHFYVKSERMIRDHSPGACSDDIVGEDFLSDMSGPSVPSSLAPSPTPFDNAALLIGRNRSKSLTPSRCDPIVKPRLTELPALSEFVDTTYWKRVKVCCGSVFHGMHGEVMVDVRFYKPCLGCTSRKQASSTVTAGVATTTLAKSYSDASSDSGYDESSNQGLGEGNHARSVLVSTNQLPEFAMHAASNKLIDSGPAN